MTKSPVSTGSFIATLSKPECSMLTDVQNKLRAERSLGQGPRDTIELPLKWCQEAIAMHRQEKASDQGWRQAPEWSLRNSKQVESIANVVQKHGLRFWDDRSNPQAEIKKLSASHAQCRETDESDPEKAKREATRVIIIAGRGLCNPSDIQNAVASFFNEPCFDAGPSAH